MVLPLPIHIDRIPGRCYISVVITSERPAQTTQTTGMRIILKKNLTCSPGGISWSHKLEEEIVCTNWQAHEA